ncbi:MAG: tetratricopeptide repeat protein [Planctomycetes bacterium]|nr:tetratricopeptide repeat protein [Planctomycetota bacterium]
MNKRAIGYILILATGCRGGISKAIIERYEGFGDNPGGRQTLENATRELAAGHVDASLALAASLRERHPDNFFVHRLYQDAMIAANRRGDLLQEYKHLCESRPSAFHYTMNSRIQESPDEGVAQAIRALDLDDQFPWAWYARGWWVAKSKDSKDADQLFRKALELHPHFFLVLRDYAISQRKNRENSSALDALEKYLREFPNRRDERVVLASLLLNAGMDERAETELRSLLEQSPGDVDCEKLLAKALLHREKVAEAKAIYERLSVAHPEDPTYDFNIAIVAEVYENNIERAAEYYKKYLDRSEGQPFWTRTQAKFWLGDIEARLGTASRPDSGGGEERKR